VKAAASHHVRFAIGLARDQLIGFRVAGEARARPQIELVPGAVADVGQVAQAGGSGWTPSPPEEIAALDSAFRAPDRDVPLGML
jgi:hypothetical protein